MDIESLPTLVPPTVTTEAAEGFRTHMMEVRTSSAQCYSPLQRSCSSPSWKSSSLSRSGRVPVLSGELPHSFTTIKLEQQLCHTNTARTLDTLYIIYKLGNGEHVGDTVVISQKTSGCCLEDKQGCTVGVSEYESVFRVIGGGGWRLTRARASTACGGRGGSGRGSVCCLGSPP